MTKKLVFGGLLMGASVMWGQQQVPRPKPPQKPEAYFDSPAWRYAALGEAPRPLSVIEEVDRRLLKIPKSDFEENIHDHLVKNEAYLLEKLKFFLQYLHIPVAEREAHWRKLLQEKNDFFLQHKDLPEQEREDLWDKLQENPELKEHYYEYLKWKAQKAQESDDKAKLEDAMHVEPTEPQRRETYVPKEKVLIKFAWSVS
ncbi:MAG: hypothetical protein ACHQVS_02430 [Candidatus Babeliales bacterium]